MASNRILPPSRPDISYDEARALIEAAQVAPRQGERVWVLGRRGYFGNSMGAPGKNDIGLYDDALVIVNESERKVEAFNANTDPSAHGESRAHLRAGVWRYRPGTHGLSRPAAQRYPAFVQAGEVVVFREGTTHLPKGMSDARGVCLGDGLWRGMFGINIHRGGYTTTSSVGCVTVYPDQWEFYRDHLKGLLRRYGQQAFDFALTEREDFR